MPTMDPVKGNERHLELQSTCSCVLHDSVGCNCKVWSSILIQPGVDGERNLPHYGLEKNENTTDESTK